MLETETPPTDVETPETAPPVEETAPPPEAPTGDEAPATDEGEGAEG